MRSTITRIIIPMMAVLLFSSCHQQDIDMFDVSDCSIYFFSPGSQVSLKGLTEPTKTTTVPLTLIGVVTDYDREVNIRIVEGEGTTAVEGKDFTMEKCVLPAGKVETVLRLEIAALADDEVSKCVTFKIEDNEFFSSNYSLNTASVTWSADYFRPGGEVWRNWYLFLSTGYSKAYHKMLTEVLGEEIEYAVSRKSMAVDGLIYKGTDWWYAVNHKVKEYVTEYDMAHIGNPLRHSDDYMKYKSYTQAEGEGERPETPPTIAETLNAI